MIFKRQNGLPMIQNMLEFFYIMYPTLNAYNFRDSKLDKQIHHNKCPKINSYYGKYCEKEFIWWLFDKKKCIKKWMVNWVFLLARIFIFIILDTLHAYYFMIFKRQNLCFNEPYDKVNPCNDCRWTWECFSKQALVFC